MSAPQFFEYQLTENTKLLQKAALLRFEPQRQQWQVLLLQRSNDAESRPKCWDLPGGNSNWPRQLLESAADLHYQDLVREIEEETSLVYPAEQVSFENLVYFSTFFDVKKQIYTMITGWQLDYEAALTQTVQLSSEHQQQAWVEFNDLSHYDFGGDKGQFVVEIIKQAFALKNEQEQ